MTNKKLILRGVRKCKFELFLLRCGDVADCESGGWDSQIHARIVSVSWDDGSITLGPSSCHCPLIIGERVKLGKAGRLQVTETLIEDD